MLDANFLSHLSKILNTRIQDHSPLSGGDINAVYLLEAQGEKWVIKTNDANRYPGMFEQEKLGLKTLMKPKVIDVSKPLETGTFEGTSYLILEHKPAGKKAADFSKIFGERLAALHRNTQANFGFKADNYIGNLRQYNKQEKTAADFYINQRLKPQFKMAAENGYAFKNLDQWWDKIRTLIPDEPPALIHGDLWGGNYLVNQNGLPCLIDPATAYAPREMDIGMMQLFGGFDASVFKSYNAVFPIATGWENRVKLWQLYYILVHLNLFGGHYYASAKAIISGY